MASICDIISLFSEKVQKMNTIIVLMTLLLLSSVTQGKVVFSILIVKEQYTIKNTASSIAVKYVFNSNSYIIGLLGMWI